MQKCKLILVVLLLIQGIQVFAKTSTETTQSSGTSLPSTSNSGKSMTTSSSDTGASSSANGKGSSSGSNGKGSSSSSNGTGSSSSGSFGSSGLTLGLTATGEAQPKESISEQLLSEGFQEGVVHISDQRAVYYQYVEPQLGRPTVVLLNGWIYPLKNWEQYLIELSSKGYGVVLIAYSTQSESLRHVQTKPYYEKLKFGPTGYPYHEGIETKDLADDVLAVVDELKLPRFHVQTLSYGSIVGSYLANHHADRLETLTLITPVVIPSQRYTPYGESRHVHYLWLNDINFNPFFIPDHSYDLEIYQSLRLVMEFGKSNLDFEGIGFETFLNGVFQMGRSAKYFDLKDEAGNVWPKTHVIFASEEEPALLKDQLNFWKLKKADAPDTTMVLVQGAPHAIPGAFPEALADISNRLFTGTISSGSHTYQAASLTWDSLDNPESAINSCGFYLGKNNSSSGSSSGSFGWSPSF